MLSIIRLVPPLFFHLAVVCALIQNVTIDDAAATGVIPQYLPSPNWTQGATCPGCGAQPDPAIAFDGTWHDATFTPSDGIAKAIEFNFTGTAIYVFFILANTIEFVDTVTDISFIIDEAPVGSFLHNPSSSSDYQYNVPVYINESLSSSQHLIRMEAAGNHSALMLFDYLVYSFDPDEASTIISSSETAVFSSTSASIPSETQQSRTASKIGPIIGGVVAGIISVAAVILTLLLYWRRKRRSRTFKPDRIMTQHIYGNRASLSSSVPGNAAVRIFSDSQDTHTSFTNDEISTNQLLINNGPKTLFKNRHNSRNQSTQSFVQVDTSTQESSGNSESNTGMLREQVEYLMDEVARLRNLQLDNRSGLETISEALPDYSEGRASPEP